MDLEHKLLIHPAQCGKHSLFSRRQYAGVKVFNIFPSLKDLYSGQNKSHLKSCLGAKFNFMPCDKWRVPGLDLGFEKRHRASPQGKYEIYVITPRRSKPTALYGIISPWR